MRTIIVRCPSGWDVYAMGEQGEAKEHLARAAALQLADAEFRSGGVIVAFITASWGLEVSDGVRDNKTLAMLGIGRSLGVWAAEPYPSPLGCTAEGLFYDMVTHDLVGGATRVSLKPESMTYAPKRLQEIE